MTPLAWPVWWALPTLQRVQFPWRLLVPVPAILAMLAALRLHCLAEARHRAAP